MVGEGRVEEGGGVRGSEASRRKSAFDDECEAVPAFQHVGAAGSKVDRFEVPPIAPGRQLIVPIGRQTVPEFVATCGIAPSALTSPDQPHRGLGRLFVQIEQGGLTFLYFFFFFFLPIARSPPI